MIEDFTGMMQAHLYRKIGYRIVKNNEGFTNKWSVHFPVATGPRNRVVPNRKPKDKPRFNEGAKRLFIKKQHHREIILKLDPSDHVSTSVMIRNIRIRILEGQLEMERHPENHTLESAAILHEIYNGMGNLNME
ncbi:hypothetical protein Tco_0645225 [Tanacetum coccineum]